MKRFLLLLISCAAGAAAVAQTATISPNFNRQTLQQAMQKRDTVVIHDTVVVKAPAKKQATAAQKSTQPAIPLKDRFFYGGNFGFSYTNDGYDDYVQLQIAPLVGFRVTPDLSAGVQVAYEFYSSGNDVLKASTNGFGGGLFARYEAPIKFLKTLNSGIFAHAEYDFMHYKTHYKNDAAPGFSDNRSELLLGAGLYVPLGGRGRMFIAALWDVLHLDDYNAAMPTFRVGIEF